MHLSLRHSSGPQSDEYSRHRKPASEPGRFGPGQMFVSSEARLIHATFVRSHRDNGSIITRTPYILTSQSGRTRKSYIEAGIPAWSAETKGTGAYSAKGPVGQKCDRDRAGPCGPPLAQIRAELPSPSIADGGTALTLPFRVPRKWRVAPARRPPAAFLPNWSTPGANAGCAGRSKDWASVGPARSTPNRRSRRG
jgi:hypothetical protein